MAKILILSTIYPALDIKVSNNTNVVHYFAREWVKQGHEVIVVYNYPIYLKIFHWIASFADKLIVSKFNTLVTSVYLNKDTEYELDGVKIIRMPLFKPFPHYRVSQHNINKQVCKIVEVCKENGFVPDAITAHNFYPHIEMVNSLKENYFKTARTCMIVHKQNLKMLNYIYGDYKKQLRKIDVWGYRSLPIKESFEDCIGFKLNSFICYSGIPSLFVNNKETCRITKPISQIIYIGSLIKRKYPEKLLYALKKSEINDFYLRYIGDGIGKSKIKRIIHNYNWDEKVRLYGFIPREEIALILAKSQCFIMISKEETFGLVYLEAMSMGCITVASRSEGMEGIIIDGFNGFLCNAGDEIELSEILNKIENLSLEDLNIISSNARKTALQLTDSNVAMSYLENLLCK